MKQANDTQNERRWLAAYVRMHHEKKVRDRLQAMGITTFLPVQTEIRQWSDRKKKVDRVLIPMMIFVHVTPAEQLQVLQQPSVLRYLVLRGEHTPAEIPANQMEAFRFMVNHSDAPISFESRHLRPGQKVRVIHGPLSGLIGELITVDNKSSIILRIERLGCAAVETSLSMIEPIP